MEKNIHIYTSEQYKRKKLNFASVIAVNEEKKTLIDREKQFKEQFKIENLIFLARMKETSTKIYIS